MPSFQIRFINNDGFVARGISWVTNSLWDHAEIMTDASTYIGAHAGSGVQERPANYCQPTRERRYAIPCTKAQLSAIMTSARADIGTQYNYLDIVGLLLRQRKLTTPGRVICSQWVFEKALVGGIQMLNVLPGFSHLVTPESLHLSPLLIGRCTYSFPGGSPGVGAAPVTGLSGVTSLPKSTT